MVVSSRIRLRGQNVSGRHELLAEATGLEENILEALLPEHGLSLQQGRSHDRECRRDLRDSHRHCL